MEGALETDRLTLRQFTPEDVENLVELDGDPEVMRYINGGRPTPRQEIERRELPAFLAYRAGSATRLRQWSDRRSRPTGEVAKGQTAWGEAEEASFFRRALLANDSIAILARYDADRIVLGAVPNRSAGAIGLSNVVHEGDDREAAYRGGASVAHERWESLPVVGYASGAALDAAGGLRSSGSTSRQCGCGEEFRHRGRRRDQCGTARDKPRRGGRRRLRSR